MRTSTDNLIDLTIQDILDKTLKGENIEKTFIIHDINKMYNLYLKRSVTTDEFDKLYDLTINKLERARENTRDLLERDSIYANAKWH